MNKSELKQRLIAIADRPIVDSEVISKDWKFDYKSNLIRKMNHKKFEQWITARIIQSIPDDLEIICQKNIPKKKNDENRQLLDIFFPSIGMYVEVDEPAHEKEEHVRLDKKRTDEVFNKTRLLEKRIKVDGKSAAQVDRETLNIINFIKNRRLQYIKRNKYQKWDFSEKFSPIPCIENEYIDADDNIAFRYHEDAMRCFGCLKYPKNRGHQPAIYDIPNMENVFLWFPKDDNKTWENILSDDWETVTTKLRDPKSDSDLQNDRDEYPIIFARYRDYLMDKPIYKFLGKFEKISEKKNEVLFKRTDKKIYLAEYWEKSGLIE